MSGPTHHGNGSGTPAAVPGTRPVLLVRCRPSLAGQTARVVHLVPLPAPGEQPGALTAMCGALLHGDQIETVTPGEGMPCDGCVLRHAAGTIPPRDREPAPAPGPVPATTPTGAVARLAAVADYRSWGWPVTLRGDQIRLSLTIDPIAVLIPVPLAGQVIRILTTRRCPPAVLVDPDAPDHQVLLAGEPYGVALPWPPCVHRITGSVLLPPSTTSRGPVTWVHRPERESLQLCREIDLLAALRTALTDPASDQP